MDKEQFSRTISLIGDDNFDKLSNSSVIIFGIGGVGGYTAEALARCGVGKITLVDSDTVSLSNINRQIIATHKTIGKIKVDAMEERLLDINPNIQIQKYNIFFDSSTESKFNFLEYNYIVDAIDTVSSKLLLIENAKKYSIPIISSMGTGNKMNPAMFEITDIYNTSVCPLARVMRYELKKRNIDSLKVLYSKEKPVKNESNRRVPASIAFSPSVAGLLIASEVVKDIIN